MRKKTKTNNTISPNRQLAVEIPGPWEVVVEVGAEGGSLRLHGRHLGTTWQFCRTVRDQTPQLLGEDESWHSSSVASTWADALALLDRYPWAELYPLKVHPNFANRILTAATERLTRSSRRADRLSDWRSIVAESSKASAGQAVEYEQILKVLYALTKEMPEYVQVTLPAGTARIKSFVVDFPRSGAKVNPALAKTHQSKRLVDVGNGPVFGEIAIAQALQRDGWSAVWADTFHRKFWSAMPGESEPIDLPATQKALLACIASFGDLKGGCFDVVAWTSERTIFLEYKGPGDRPNRNESLWIQAALEAGVSEEDLFFVGVSGRASS